ncbi:hypothetical protein [Sphaerisporangium corydalis]|uniref:Uncharacterized protein n=1 Tax=Sphaerisporangium corydalis TaxID=1441875 RepID=A0ABV9E8D0_9ACTN|nr:hypothetical protein [Sphaerisporangium corydalis]
MKAHARMYTIVGLVVGAAGIGILWASGVKFPIAIPPGILILLAGALFVGLTPWRWSPAVGSLLGLFVIVGFLISPTGVGNLVGDHGASVSIGSVIQLVGVLTALVTGVIATRDGYRAAGRR